MEAGHGRAPAAEPCGMAGGVPEISGYSPVPRAQRGHEPCAISGDLLVGMDTPPACTQHRCGVPAAFPVLPLARLDPATPAGPAVGNFHRRRSARGSWLVDGIVG